MTELTLDNISLKKCFQLIIKDEYIEITIDQANKILSKDLSVDFDVDHPQIRELLPQVLSHYMMIWPGWSKSNNKQLNVDSWYEKFQEYLSIKLMTLRKKINKISNQDENKTTLLDMNLHKLDTDTQTDEPRSEKEVAPFVLDIKGSVKLMNSLIFSDYLEPEDVLMKEYKPVVEWGDDPLKVEQLINWPFISVEFQTTEIHFERISRLQYQRFLSLSTDKHFCKERGSIIEATDLIEKDQIRTVYTQRVFQEYCKKYIELMRVHKEFLEWKEKDLTQIETILKHFLWDIKDIGKNSIPVNQWVRFKIGSSMYGRNKSFRNEKKVASLRLSELLDPHMELRLVDFKGMLNSDGTTNFPKLEKLLSNKNSAEIVNFIPKIKWSCIFCEEMFHNSAGIWSHLKSEHFMEQRVLCFRCKQQFDFERLAENRFYHKCGGK